MKEFILTYWKQILDVVSILFCLIFFFLKKKPLGNVFAMIFRYCLAAVMMAEEHPVKGQEKLDLAVEAVKELILEEYPTLNFDKYRKYVVGCIESILSTPQKKGE